MLNTRVRGFAAFLLATLSLGVASAQPTPDQQAEAILNAGRKAYNDGNPQFAAEKFNELLTKFGGSIDNWDGQHWGQETMTQVLIRSNNIGAAWVSEQLGTERLVKSGAFPSDPLSLLMASRLLRSAVSPRKKRRRLQNAARASLRDR